MAGTHLPLQKGFDKTAMQRGRAKEPLTIKPGDSVEVHGLSSESGRHLNGRRGIVESYIEEKARFEVRLEARSAQFEVVNVKRENLIAGLDTLACDAEHDATGTSQAMLEAAEITPAPDEASAIAAPNATRALEERAAEETILQALPPRPERQPVKRARLSGGAVRSLEAFRHEQERQRQEEEAIAEEKRQRAAEERQRAAEEKRQRAAEERQRAAEERQRAAEERKRRADEHAARRGEERRLLAEAAQRRRRSSPQAPRQRAAAQTRDRSIRKQAAVNLEADPSSPSPKKKARRCAPTTPNSGLRRRSPMTPRTPSQASSSDGRFPRPAWAREMVHTLLEDLEARLKGRGLGVRPVRIATDCSGADAPIFALREIAEEISRELGDELGVQHVFSCDVLAASRVFIYRNCAPQAFFADLLARRTVGPCILKRRLRRVPGDVDIYVAGFPCKDFSSLNHERPCLDGPHAKVFYGVTRYITEHEPRVFILENVKGLMMRKGGNPAPIVHVLKTLRAIPNYKVHCWQVNTEDYYLPQHRKRVYIVGVNTKKAKLKIPFSEWEDLLCDLQGEPPDEAHAWLLGDDEPEVCDEEERLRLKPNTGAKLITPTVPVQYGMGGKWIQNHMRQRKMLGIGEKRPLTQRGRGWTKFLSARSRDVLDLIAAKVSATDGGIAEETNLCAEISRGLGYTSLMRGSAPCVTPSGCLWFFNRWRWAIGVEMMALQGFPVDDLDFDDLGENEICALAGNAMSVPVIGAFLLLVLAAVQFPDSATSTAGEVVASDHSAEEEAATHGAEDKDGAGASASICDDSDEGAVSISNADVQEEPALTLDKEPTCGGSARADCNDCSSEPMRQDCVFDKVEDGIGEKASDGAVTCNASRLNDLHCKGVFLKEHDGGKGHEVDEKSTEDPPMESDAGEVLDVGSSGEPEGIDAASSEEPSADPARAS